MKAISIKAIEKYEKDGYLKISNLISKKLVDTIKKEYKDYLNKIISLDKKKKRVLLAKKFNFISNPSRPSSIHRLKDNKKSFFFKLSKNKKFANIAEKLMGEKSKLQDLQFFFKNKEQNMPTPMHQDNAYWCYKNGKGLSIWIPLNKTNKKNGTLFYLKGSHNKNIPHNPSSTTPGSSLIIKKKLNYNKVSFKLNAGDCVIHDSKTVHGSYQNKLQKDRAAFIICFVTKRSTKDRKLQINYNNNLVKVNNSRLKLLN
jgi:ectoine hydroxylase-related dioxygenase (phytanoyl-CoA dioxygenase family)